MKSTLKVALVLTIFTLAFVSCKKQVVFEENDISIIPKPQEMVLVNSSFTFTKKSAFFIENEIQQSSAEFLAAKFKKAAGLKLDIKIGEKATKNSVVFKTIANIANEGYILEIKNNQIEISASQPAGFFYGVQTLRQLLPPEIDNNERIEADWIVPTISIKDHPQFKWRGFMLDVSRHFQPKSYILELIDNLALHKINTLHLHLVDDQGWRVEIKKYPKLTEVGAWRVDHEDKHWNSRPKQEPEEKATYGGFYTQEDIKEIVAYAQQRHITIVPEIEMPAHVTSALASYPEYSCTGGPFTVPSGGLWPITDIYCAGNDETFHFLEDVLDEVLALFPSKYIHIGGDEATKTEWGNCPKCQNRLKLEGLENVEELQSYFIKRIEKYLVSKNRVLIGWDEILEGGLAPEATVMSWRGFKGGIEAAEQGHDVVMTPTGFCYFDYYQGPEDQEPLAWGGSLPVSKVYQFNPIPKEMSQEAAKHVIGGQANLWTEYVPTEDQADYMTFPRIAALSEAVWTKTENKNWEDFSRRMNVLLSRYDKLGINYAKSAFNIRTKATLNSETKKLQVILTSELEDVEIRYTIDGTEPDRNAKLYTNPVALKETTLLKAVTLQKGKIKGKIFTQKFSIHIATVKPISYKINPNGSYQGSGEFCLVNSIRGTKNHGDGEWQGWNGDNMEVIIDLGKPTQITKLTCGALQNAGAWIFLPQKVEFYGSEDGKEYKKLGQASHSIDPLAGDKIIFDFSIDCQSNATYVKVIAENIGFAPKGHMGEGSKAWLFVDEIIVE